VAWSRTCALPGFGVPAARARLLDDPHTALVRYLQDLSARCPVPLVMLFDEADGLVGDTMVSFLTQLRRGYVSRRKTSFPHSIALIGRRTVRDYVLTREERVPLRRLGTTSPFNISAEAASLGAFNALADPIVERSLRDRTAPVAPEHVEAAKEAIILERRTHVDSLVAKLREPRVRRILDPMLAGDETEGDVLDDDFAYVLGLGLIRAREGQFEIANPIYREVVPRALTYVRQMQIAQQPAAFVRPDGSLDMPKLMATWQVYWREHGHLAAAGFGYQESGPHLMLMAFLQRIVNGGGKIDREYGLGRGALDLMVAWQGQRHAIEVKLRRDTQTEERALEQVVGYLDTMGLDEGWLVMFDLRSTLSWADRLTSRTVETAGKRVHVVGC
jgi:hypothetical protein